MAERSHGRRYAALLGMFPARLSAQRQEGRRDPDRAGFLRALETGRSSAPIAEGGQVENDYKERFGAILRQAGTRRGVSEAQIAEQLRAAARDADSLLRTRGR